MSVKHKFSFEHKFIASVFCTRRQVFYAIIFVSFLIAFHTIFCCFGRLSKTNLVNKIYSGNEINQEFLKQIVGSVFFIGSFKRYNNIHSHTSSC